MKLHEDKEAFKDLVTIIANDLNILPIYVEKDYWVTAGLKAVFSSSVGDEIVFKGGTALAKCHRIINRFSEDIDLVILRSGTESDNQLKRKLKKVSSAVGGLIEEIDTVGITHKRGTIRKTAHAYEKTFTGVFGQVRPLVVVEVTWLGNFEPYTILPVSNYFSDYLSKNGREDLISKYGLAEFQAKVLTKERTTCEKIMSLVRFSNQGNVIRDLSNKVRHLYDLAYLLEDKEVSCFFESTDFEKMINKVGAEDLVSFKNNNKWLQIHPKEAAIFSNSENIWRQVRVVYFGVFQQLVPATLPPEEKIIATINRIANRLKQIDWEHEV